MKWRSSLDPQHWWRSSRKRIPDSSRMISMRPPRSHLPCQNKINSSKECKGKRKSRSWDLYADSSLTWLIMKLLRKNTLVTKSTKSSSENSRRKSATRSKLSCVCLTPRRIGSTWNRWSGIMLERISWRRISRKCRWSNNFLTKRTKWSIRCCTTKERANFQKIPINSMTKPRQTRPKKYQNNDDQSVHYFINSLIISFM